MKMSMNSSSNAPLRRQERVGSMEEAAALGLEGGEGSECEDGEAVITTTANPYNLNYAGVDARKPYKVVDARRESRKGIMAASLGELVQLAKQKLMVEPGSEVRIVLEYDGTEIDDEEYFSTLEPDTVLMLLCNTDKWVPTKQLRSWSSLDQADGMDNEIEVSSSIEELVSELREDLSALPWLSGKELELLAEMNVDSLLNVVPDRRFLQMLQDASCRYLGERQEACDAIGFLQMYRKSSLTTAAVHMPSSATIGSIGGGGASGDA